MAFVVKDRVQETSTTTGTGSFALAGAISGYQTFSNAVGNANTTYYAIVGDGQWETGIGTYSSSGNTLSRDTVIESSTGAKVVFSAGTKRVFVTYPATKAVDVENAQTLTNKTLGTGTAVTAGTINGAVIGGSTPSAGTFTTLVSDSSNVKNGNNSGVNTKSQFILDWGGSGNGYNHFITSNHDANANSANNSVSFWINNIGSQNGSSAPNVNNVRTILTNPLYTSLLTAGGEQFRATNAASAVNYLQATGSATGSGPTISAQGSDTNIDLNLTAKGTGSIFLQSNGGTLFKANPTVASATNWVEVRGHTTGNSPLITSEGGDSNISLRVRAKGTGAVSFETGASPANQFLITNTASAVNYVQVTGAATTGRPTISAQGSDTNIDLNLTAKGTGAIRSNVANSVTWLMSSASTTVARFMAGGQSVLEARFSVPSFMRFLTGSAADFSLEGAEQFRVANTASAVNYIQATGAATTAAPAISAQGSDTNIDLTLTPKGTGLVRFGTYTAGAPTATGYISIKAADGTTYKVLVST